MQARASRVGRCAAAALLLALAQLGWGAVRTGPPAPPPPRVDINSAAPAQLATLPGIGPLEARRIVEGRPYLSKAELATRHVLPEGLFIQIKDRIVAIQKTGTPKPAAAARKASGP